MPNRLCSLPKSKTVFLRFQGEIPLRFVSESQRNTLFLKKPPALAYKINVTVKPFLPPPNPTIASNSFPIRNRATSASFAFLTIASAIGCSERDSALPAIERTSFQRLLEALISVTIGLPMVRVPVLSKAMVLALCDFQMSLASIGHRFAAFFDRSQQI